MITVSKDKRNEGITHFAFGILKDCPVTYTDNIGNKHRIHEESRG
jgi:hypothetical protein